jgi:hypothetical protein
MNGNYSWAAYNASLQSVKSLDHPDVSVLLPMFRDPAHSPAMICHAMNIIASATRCTNPGQIPVVALDQPLYSLAKQIQWKWPEKYGADKFVIMLGALHIEMAFLKTIGDYLDGNGWTSALISVGIATSGRSEAMLRASHVMRSRHAHQVSLACLYIMQQHAYTHYVQNRNTDDLDAPASFTDWCENQGKSHPQFKCWDTVLRLELALMTFIRSLRESDFDLFLEAQTQLVPWFFGLNHQNYARWASVHLHDMRLLNSIHPKIAQEFKSGNFTVNTTGRPFSAIGIDHAHEHLNARVKGIGGAVGLTENPDALHRWMTAGPEVTHVIDEFEQAATIVAEHDSATLLHHEQTPSQQTLFVKPVTSLVAAFEEMGNPFADNGKCIYVVDMHNICFDAVIDTVINITAVGHEQ